MKKLKKSILAVIGIFLLVALFAAFITWDLNPENWGSGVRLGVALFTGAIGSVVVAAITIEN